tara:strand:+ start:409 stop:1080 length:672 start_codon:yes stop_codon:yes gene_type:complete
MKETLKLVQYPDPFPHIIVKNFYNPDELDLIWEELDFYTKPGKLMKAEDFGGIVGYTNSSAIILDQLYRNYSTGKHYGINGNPNFRPMSNILTVNRKIFTSGVLDAFADIHGCCSIAPKANFDATKVRYYHDKEYYRPHTDKSTQYLAFTFFHKEPKKYGGGDLFFPEYDYEYGCDNNSLIVFPGWVRHGVNKVSIKDSDYYEGYGRYSITTFFSNVSEQDRA